MKRHHPLLLLLSAPAFSTADRKWIEGNREVFISCNTHKMTGRSIALGFNPSVRSLHLSRPVRATWWRAVRQLRMARLRATALASQASMTAASTTSFSACRRQRAVHSEIKTSKGGQKESGCSHTTSKNSGQRCGQALASIPRYHQNVYN